VSTGVLHDAAGLTISATEPIPGLPRAPRDRPADLHIHLESRPPWHSSDFHPFHTSSAVDSFGRPMIAVARSRFGYHFEYSDGTQAWVDCEGSEIWCTTAPQATLADTATYLTGPILGFALRRRGALSLHASAVTVGESALLMVGGHGRGKSTTAAALARRGCALITDDVMHLRPGGSGWFAEPFAAGLRLWPEAVTLVFGPDVSLPRITPTWDKRVLEAPGFDVTPTARAVPVRWIAFLEPREAGAQAPRLSPIGAAESVVALAANSSASHLLDHEARANEFGALGDLVSRVRCTKAVASDRPGTLQPFVDLLYAWASEDTAGDAR
jgi:hypothetical protein